MYKHRKLAIKLISLPEEYGDLATFLGKQFTSEVASVKASRLISLQSPRLLSKELKYDSKKRLLDWGSGMFNYGQEKRIMLLCLNEGTLK